jgi:hypothetical protein
MPRAVECRRMTLQKWMGLAALGTGITVVGALRSVGPPRLVFVNAGLQIEYPVIRGLAALGAMAGVALIAAALPKLALRLLACVAALGVCFVALHLLLYRLEATDAGLLSRGVLGTAAIAWKEVVGVDRGGDELIVTGRNDRQIRIDTTDFEPDQRATLERTIARRVQESGGKLTVPGL